MLFLYVVYSFGVSFYLWVCTADGAKKHKFLVIVLDVATFVAVDVECLIHILILSFNKGNDIFLPRLMQYKLCTSTVFQKIFLHL